jgi:hypothetical protein
MKEWWSKLKPIHKGVGDGQEMTWVYTRKVKSDWEYALVRMSDDGTFQGVTILKNGEIDIEGHTDL